MLTTPKNSDGAFRVVTLRLSKRTTDRIDTYGLRVDAQLSRSAVLRRLLSSALDAVECDETVSR